jgi:hypothetical protein
MPRVRSRIAELRPNEFAFRRTEHHGGVRHGADEPMTSHRGPLPSPHEECPALGLATQLRIFVFLPCAMIALAPFDFRRANTQAGERNSRVDHQANLGVGPEASVREQVEIARTEIHRGSILFRDQGLGGLQAVGRAKPVAAANDHTATATAVRIATNDPRGRLLLFEECAVALFERDPPLVREHHAWFENVARKLVACRTRRGLGRRPGHQDEPCFPQPRKSNPRHDGSPWERIAAKIVRYTGVIADVLAGSGRAQRGNSRLPRKQTGADLVFFNRSNVTTSPQMRRCDRTPTPGRRLHSVRFIVETCQPQRLRAIEHQSRRLSCVQSTRRSIIRMQGQCWSE